MIAEPHWSGHRLGRGGRFGESESSSSSSAAAAGNLNS